MKDKNTGYKVKANEFIFSFTKEEIDAADLIKKSSLEFNLVKDHRSLNARLISADTAAKKLTIEVEGGFF
jgi:hypothetical protein